MAQPKSSIASPLRRKDYSIRTCSNLLFIAGSKSLPFYPPHFLQKQISFKGMTEYSAASGVTGNIDLC